LPPLPPLLPGFVAYAAQQRLILPGSRVIAAVSGGADSTCLLHLLLATRERLDITLEVAHFNHRLRGRRSERDAVAVEELAQSAGLRFHLGLGEAFTPQQQRAASVQELAREMRLGFLLGLARRRRAVVALGHTGDDQAETLLMRFLAGAGPAGLGGIPPASHGGRLVHPLLFARRSAIESWLAARSVPWRTDHTNRTRRYLRNRVRLDLLPVIARDFNPRIVERLGALAQALRRDNDCLEAHAAQLLEAAAVGTQRYAFTPAVLASTPPAVLSRALLAALRAIAGRPTDFSHRHIAALLAPGTGARSWVFPAGVSGSRDGAGLVLQRAAAVEPAAGLDRRSLPVPGRVALPGLGILSSSIRPRPAGFDPRVFGADPWRSALDLDSVHQPLTIRGRRPGDRFQPLGLPADKKLKELFIGAGIPAGIRARVPLICDRDGIVWVTGLRPAERCRVHAATRRLLVLELEAGEGTDQAAAAGRRRRAISLQETRGPAMIVSSSSRSSRATRSGRVRP